MKLKGGVFRDIQVRSFQLTEGIIMRGFVFCSFLVFSSVFATLNAHAGLTPEDYGTYCPADFTSITPKIFLSENRLTRTVSPVQVNDELHRIVCERYDVNTGQLKSRWNFYFCEDLNVNHYSEKDFSIELTSWFTFHPNFKRAEFMLFPKYPRLFRTQRTQGTKADLIALSFMLSFESQMEIWFAQTEDGSLKIEKGSKSIAASIFMNIRQKPIDDPVSCTIQ